VVTALRGQKRVDLLLEAAPLVLARVPEARIAVVGDGPLGAELRTRAAALGLDDRVRFFPFVPPASRQLRSVDVYVLPSDWEAMSIGLLEALACGVPQVATDVGGSAEVVTDDTGILCPPGDAAALADAVTALLADPARRQRLAEGSRRRHADGFTLPRMLGETAAVYRDAVAPGLRAPARAARSARASSPVR
jgi:glycosyltransferase involved in cell wall biosynthesis